MYRLLFRDWRFALAWAVLTCVGIASFFQKDGGYRQFEQQAAQIRAQRQALPVPSPAPVATWQADPDQDSVPRLMTPADDDLSDQMPVRDPSQEETIR